MTTKKPKSLASGDTIGVFSPSSSISEFSKRTERATANLESLGYRVLFGENARGRVGFDSGTPEQRASDFNRLIRNDEVRAVLCSTGGFTTNTILDLIDFELISNCPKIVCGYSDLTSLLCALYVRSKLVTFYGPSLLPTFGEIGGSSNYSARSFRTTLGSVRSESELVSSKVYSDEFLYWDRDDERERVWEEAPDWFPVYEGKVEGTLLGGNITSLLSIAGTKYFPSFQNCILILEQSGCTLSELLSQLTQLEQCGVFEASRGLLFGRASQLVVPGDKGLFEVLLPIAKRHKLPTIMNVDLGHTHPRLTVPLGVKAAIEVGEKVTVSLRESPVT